MFIGFTDFAVENHNNAENLQISLERYNLLLLEYLTTLINLVGVTSSIYNREVICGDDLSSHGHLTFTFKFLVTLRSAVLP